MKINSRFCLSIKETIFVSLIVMMAAPSVMAMFTSLPSKERQKKIIERQATMQNLFQRKIQSWNAKDEELVRQLSERISAEVQEVKISKEAQKIAQRSALKRKKSEQAAELFFDNFVAEEKIAKELQLHTFQQRHDPKKVKWVRTVDKKIAIPLWQADQMGIFQTKATKRDIGTKDYPVDLASEALVNSFDIQLLSDAYDALANGTFKEYCDNLLDANEGVQITYYGKIISLGSGRFRRLINIADKMDAFILSNILHRLAKNLLDLLHNRVFNKYEQQLIEQIDENSGESLLKNIHAVVFAYLYPIASLLGESEGWKLNLMELSKTNDVKRLLWLYQLYLAKIGNISITDEFRGFVLHEFKKKYPYLARLIEVYLLPPRRKNRFFHWLWGS